MSEQLPSVEEQYLWFCDNALRGDQTVCDEYAMLLANPMVEGVGFYQSNTLVIATKMITIEDPDDAGWVYDIGEFLIFVYREREGRRWMSDFCFINASGPLLGDTAYLHPHIVASDPTVEAINAAVGDVGRLCIQQGQFHIFQLIRDGKMHLVAKALIDILHTYGTGKPFIELQHWPRREL